MRIKAADKYVHILKFVPDRYKTQKIYIKAVGIHPSTSFVIHPSSDQHKTQQMCVKAVNTYYFVNISLKKCVTKLLMIMVMH